MAQVMDKVRKENNIGIRSSINIGIAGTYRQGDAASLALKNAGVKAVTLTLKEERAYQALRNNFDSLWQGVNDAREKVGEAPLPYIENYMTIQRVVKRMEDKNFNLLSITPNDFIKMRDTPFPFENRKVSKIMNELNAFDVFRRYSEIANKYIYMAPTIASLREALDVRWKVPKYGMNLETGVKEAVLDKNGNQVYTRMGLQDTSPDFYNGMNEYLNRNAGMRPNPILDSPKLDKVLRTLTRNYAAAVLGFNMRVMATQLTSLNGTAAEIGINHTNKAIMQWMTSKTLRDFAWKESHILNSRMNEVALFENLQDLMFGRTHGTSLKDRVQGGIQGLQLKSTLGIQLFDNMVATTTWLAAFDKAKKDGMMKVDAVNYADDMVVKTQASATSADIAPIQAHTVGKIMTMFQTFVIRRFNWLDREVFQLHSPTKDYGRMASVLWKFMLGTAMINSLYNSVGANSPEPAPIHAYLREKQASGSTLKGLQGAAFEMRQIFPVLGSRYGSAPLFNVMEQLKAYSDPHSTTYKSPLWVIMAQMAGVPGVSQIDLMIHRKKQGLGLPAVILGKDQ
jgi:hypothetical protein